MAKTMKMEPAPWIRDYVTDMEEFYTELILEKLDQKLLSVDRQKLNTYKDLFKQKKGFLKYLDILYYYPPAVKVLFKGIPGMGKTSLVKKIAWDWGARLFDQVDIVFFVQLKFVKPT